MNENLYELMKKR